MESNLQETSGSQVGEELDDVLGNGWGSRQMSSLGLESVLIGNPVDGELLSLSGEGVRSLGNGTDFVSDDFLLSALFHFDAVVSFVAMTISS